MPEITEINACLADYLEWMAITNYSERTIKNHRINLGYVIDWLAERDITAPGEVTLPILERYQRYLFYYRKENGDPLSFRSQNIRLSPIRSFFKWLTKNHYILYNPASELELPRMEKRLPRHVLSISEVDQVMNQTDIESDVGIRDRAILESFYSTGIRRKELRDLKITDLDRDRGTLMIRQGKGRKDRVVPIGLRAVSWIDRYLTDIRPDQVVYPDDGTLFLTIHGGAFSLKQLSHIVSKYIEAAKIDKQGGCHLLRHTMATLMLENGADIRYIQHILGHEDLNSTQIYTRISISKLKEVHDRTHPSATLKRKIAE